MTGSAKVKPAKFVLGCERAVDILASLQSELFVFTADEIEELMKHGLAIEADPDQLAIVQQLAPVVREYAQVELDDPTARDKVAAAHAALKAKLESDWHRFTTSDEKLAKRERERAVLRRALALLGDPAARSPIIGIAIGSRSAPPGAAFRACAQLGDELYAITARGAQVHRELALRLGRYASAPLAAFLKSFDKIAGKMQALGNEVAVLSNNVGFVKNPHQVVIGLVKSGAPAQQALAHYHGLGGQRAPDLAVTCARNATAFGGSLGAAQRLRACEYALRETGLPMTQNMIGAAKSLLPYEPISHAAHRFAELVNRLGARSFEPRDHIPKYAARLMPAHGAPEVVVARAMLAMSQLIQIRGACAHHRLEPYGVALASMVETPEEIAPLAARFRELEHALVGVGLGNMYVAADLALECVGCAGSIPEVITTVQALVQQLAGNRQFTHADVAIAAAFAKRFAY